MTWLGIWLYNISAGLLAACLGVLLASVLIVATYQASLAWPNEEAAAVCECTE
jgi:hypothetical protein